MTSSALEHELILGRYRPLRPLGSGGMGHVWLARDEQSGLDVALKMVAREGKVAERAEREARAAAALRHPRCQRIYALARDTSHIYIAYEYIPGRTMRQALSAGELRDRDAVEAATQILEALAHAHGRGIVHRDVKPSNILLGEGAGIDVRLLDFGLAQMAEFDTLTAIGDVPGTLTYVSPERLLGETATAAADVWAVGVMLWEALAGHHPFRSDSVEETTRRIQAGAPPLETVRPDVPAVVRNAVAQALVLNPARRPSAARLASDLRLPTRKRRRGPGDGGRVRTPPAVPIKLRIAGELPQRILTGAFAGIWTGWTAATLPFYPAGWTPGLAAGAAALGIASPRAGVAFALATTLLPLGNVSLGLALLFAVAAVAWTAFTWNDPRGNLVLVAAPVLGPLAALGFLPLVAQLPRGPVRRGVQAAVGVLVAVLVAGIEHRRLPFDGSLPPLGLGISGSRRPTAVAYALWQALADHPVVIGEAAALAAVAVVLPFLRGRGPWAAAAGGATLLAATALIAPAAAFLPLAVAAWLTAVALTALPPVEGGDPGRIGKASRLRAVALRGRAAG